MRKIFFIILLIHNQTHGKNSILRKFYANRENFSTPSSAMSIILLTL